VKLATFALGTALLVGLSLLGQDPLWTPLSSVLAAVAAYWTAPRVIDIWVRQRRLTPQSLLFWYIGAGLPFDLAQLAYTGTLRPSWSAANLVASTPLLLAAGIVWTVDVRRFWLPASAASAFGRLALLAWAWPR
jgi:hypothetical protein